jgi:hypothetical protein
LSMAGIALFCSSLTYVCIDFRFPFYWRLQNCWRSTTRVANKLRLGFAFGWNCSHCHLYWVGGILPVSSYATAHLEG